MSANDRLDEHLLWPKLRRALWCAGRYRGLTSKAILEDILALAALPQLYLKQPYLKATPVRTASSVDLGLYHTALEAHHPGYTIYTLPGWSQPDLVAPQEGDAHVCP